MELTVVIGIATLISFYMYSNLSVYQALYHKTREENYETEAAKNKLERMYTKQYESYVSVSASKDNLAEELETSIEQYKEVRKRVQELEKEKEILETKIEQLYDTIGNN